MGCKNFSHCVPAVTFTGLEVEATVASQAREAAPLYSQKEHVRKPLAPKDPKHPQSSIPHLHH